MNIVIALGVATVKATLVILFFMHGKYSSRRTKLVIVSGFFWLALCLASQSRTIPLVMLSQAEAS